jgi:uncharacterized SAM-binding protein YcdF (DUF218 family)
MLLIVVHRFLEAFILPPLNSIIIMLIGYLVMRYRKGIGAGIFSIGVLTLYIQSTLYFASYINHKLEVPPLNYKQLNEAQAIVVLGGGVKNSIEYPRGVVPTTGTLIRVNYAAQLARKYPNKLIVTSGGYTSIKYSEANIMRNALINSYFIHNQIIVENKSRNTEENAKFVAQILKPMNITRIAIVTQAFHMKRAEMLFKKYGLDPIPASTDYFYSEEAEMPAVAFLPSAKAMHYTARALHEIFGYVIYSLKSNEDIW